MRERRNSPDSSRVGYQHPPAERQFKAAESGNPAGRPTGRLNVANLIKEIFNETVPVREGNRTRRLPTAEAIIRSLVAKAGQGDASALFTVMDLIEMSGRMDELGDEELGRRQMVLPGSFSMAERDLTISPAREQERQRYLAMFEQGEGYRHAARNEPEAALAVYRRDIKACKEQLAADPSRAQASKGLASVIAGIGLLADKLLLAGEFRSALECADEAISESSAGSDLIWVRVIRAHALMLLGRADEARALYARLPRNGQGEMATSWQKVISQDFDRLRQAGHRHALMDEIEEGYRAAGWLPGEKNTDLPAISPDDAIFILTAPDSIKTGDLLAQQGELDRAGAAYRGRLATCRAKLKQDASHVESKKDLQIASARLGGLARSFLLVGGCGRALECTTEAISHDPNSVALQVIHAHALMFSGRAEEAQEIFLQLSGHKDSSGKSVDAIVLEDFAQFRAAGRSHPLMDEIANALGAGAAVAPTPADNISPAINDGESTIAEPDDLGSGDLRDAQKTLDGAADIELGDLANCKAKLARDPNDAQAQRDLTRAISAINQAAFKFLLARRYDVALAVADQALAVLPDCAALHVARAHAFMFLGRQSDAMRLHRTYGGTTLEGGATWNGTVRDDFAALRAAGLKHPLMDEIQK
jgi:tetratricopeptide (TPR) repeat protein